MSFESFRSAFSFSNRSVFDLRSNSVFEIHSRVSFMQLSVFRSASSAGRGESEEGNHGSTGVIDS